MFLFYHMESATAWVDKDKISLKREEKAHSLLVW